MTSFLLAHLSDPHLGPMPQARLRDLASKRGQVTGTQPRADGNVSISGLIPLAELDEYQGRLKSLTGGKGSYSITFSHYAQVPAQTQQQLASNFKAEALADD